MTLETVEMVIYTIAVGNSPLAGGYLVAGIAGTVGFIIPWFVVIGSKDRLMRISEWKRSIGIGSVLIIAAIIFSTLRTVGLL